MSEQTSNEAYIIAYMRLLSACATIKEEEAKLAEILENIRQRYQKQFDSDIRTRLDG